MNNSIFRNIGSLTSDNEEEGSKEDKKMGKKQFRSCPNFKANVKAKAVKNSVLF